MQITHAFIHSCYFDLILSKKTFKVKKEIHLNVNMINVTKLLYSLIFPLRRSVESVL
jgi:hypothetical protein